ncbi:MAG: ribose-phosphate pyrophosphokinase [Oceanospirillaceae bacterium]|nr:ribose-phosphate pyrophosphokinase [Oceanospirillaceae bacterium]MCP5350214.1 ribose-phosphate pyrophosphokinase [Oceanospirillaceae bacterium]
MSLILFSLPALEAMAGDIRRGCGATAGEYEMRHFPDGETYVRVLSDVAGAEVAVLWQLHQPDSTVLPLLMLVNTLKDLGAKRVGLVAPYLAYMRQDKRFHAGEGISQRYFARLLSQQVDWLVTVDPHLHRISALSEVYTIPALAMTAVEPMAGWIRTHVTNPVVIGPDGESEQWAASVAKAAGCPCEVLTKERFGDRDVKVSLPHVDNYRGHTPVLVDDIISTGKTMIQAAQHLMDAGLSAPVCIGVHGIFAAGAQQEMAAAGLKVVTCDSIADHTNAIALGPLLARGMKEILQ